MPIQGESGHSEEDQINNDIAEVDENDESAMDNKNEQ
jgi:hypothetical protein